MHKSLRHVNKLKLKRDRQSRINLIVHSKDIDFKNINLLQRFVSVNGAISNRHVVGNSKKHRKIVRAIKRARYLGLMAF